MASPSSIDSPPCVSVIMAVYNAEFYLAEAIESVLSQTFTDFEFLIHDDGSSDGSRSILQRYAARDPRIRISSGENRGPAHARNILIGSARSVYLAVMDADDVCRPERFECQVEYLNAHPDVAVLGSFIRYIDIEGRPVRDMDYPLTHEEIDVRNLSGYTAFLHPSVMMRREMVLAVGGYNEDFVPIEDVDLVLRIGEHYKLANYPHVLLDYRFHPFSLSASEDGNPEKDLRARQDAARRRGMDEGTLEMRPPWTWRPAPDRRSQSDFAVQWAWQSYNANYPHTARHYFFKALKLNPFSHKAWNGFVFGLLRDKGQKQ